MIAPSLIDCVIWSLFYYNSLCVLFVEFGVFVDSNGRRSRPDDMKWSGLPLYFSTTDIPSVYSRLVEVFVDFGFSVFSI